MSKYPKVRIKNFDEPWILKKFDEIFFERHQIGYISKEYPQLSFTIADGVINPEDRKTNNRDFLIIDKANKKYLITEYNDIIYNPANVVYGAIHRNKYKKGVVSPIYRIFWTNQNPTFMENIVRNERFIKQIARRTEGTVTKLKTLKPEAFLDMESYVSPNLTEQNEIGKIITSIDDLIEKQSQKVEKINYMKQNLLNKLFPAFNEKKPKLRLMKFNEDWQNCSLGSLCEVVTKQTGFDYSSTIKPSLISYNINNTLPYLQTKNFSGINFNYDTDYYIPIRIANQFEKIMLNKKCILISIVGSIGNVAFFPNEVKCFLGGAICVAKLKEEEKTEFVYYYLSSNAGQRQLKDSSKGTTQTTVTIEDIRNFDILYPESEEARKIGKILKNIDSLIELNTKKLEDYKKIKNYLLNNMFV